MPTIRGSPTTATGTGTSVVVNVPANAVKGDVLVLGLASDVVVTVTKPGSWTLVRRTVDTAAGNDQVLETYTKVVDGTETASYTWTLSASNAFCAAMQIVQDAQQTVTPHKEAGQENAAGVTGTAPSVTTTIPNCLLIGMFASDISPSGAVTTTSGMTTEIVDINTGSWANLAIYTEQVAATGATGTRTCTFSAASNGNMGHLLAFAPLAPLAPTNFDNPPPRKASGLFAVAVGLVLTTLGIVSAPPFTQMDWPNPTPKVATQRIEYQRLLTLRDNGSGFLPRQSTRVPRGVLRAANVEQVPNTLVQVLQTNSYLPRDVLVANRIPDRKVTQIDPVKTFALTYVAPGAAPFAQLDWKNPNLRQTRFDFIGAVPTPLIVQGTSFLPREATIGKGSLRKVQQPDIFANRMPLTVVGADQNSYIFREALVTKIERVKVIEQPVAFSRLDVGFIPNLTKPFNQAEWYIPTLKRGSVTNLTKLNSGVPDLDQIYGAAGQVPSYDWPNPKGYVYPVGLRTWTQNLLESTLYVVPAPPFSQDDWQNPRGYVPSIVLKSGGERNIPVGLIPPPGNPLLSLDWPNPKLPVRPNPSFTFEVYQEFIPVKINTGRSKFWRAKQQIDWSIPFNPTEEIKPTLASIDLQITDQKEYKNSLVKIKETEGDLATLEEEIARVEQKIRELRAQKQEYYKVYHDFIAEYKAEKARQRELKEEYLEEVELMELLEALEESE